MRLKSRKGIGGTKKGQRKGLPKGSCLPLSERLETFRAQVDYRDLHECWPWKGKQLETTGYGKFWLNKKMHTAHRAYWIMTIGEIPPGMFACHKCDNRICVNPSHIFIGTSKENSRDMWSKGRASKPPSSAKITEDDVRRIRAAQIFGKRGVVRISRLLGLPLGSVKCALDTKNKWKHVK